MKHEVQSSDGVRFTTDSEERSVLSDRLYSLTKSAAELAAHGDFRPLDPPQFECSDLGVANLRDANLSGASVAPAPEGPLERRAAFRLIQGGRTS